jgi:archaellum biogenesis ATPase FlaH
MTGPIRAEDVQGEAVSFLWRDRLPRGMISVVGGKTDQGKGLLSCLITAEVTRAGGKVLYSATEDSHAIMTKPRLEAAGAKIENVLLWRFRLPEQMNELAKHVIDNNIDLIVMDPVAGHMRNRYSDAIRDTIEPLTELIETTGTAVLMIEHVLKRVSANAGPLAAIGGSSSGLMAATRMAFLFGKDPSDDDRRILACVKHNVTKDDVPAISFEVDFGDTTNVDEVPFLLVDDTDIVFDPIRLVTMESGRHGRHGPSADKRAAAAEWLTNYLVAKGSPTHAGLVIEDAKQWGMTTKTLRRAATDMGIVRNPPGGGQSCTWWLPDEILDLLEDPTDVGAEVEALSESLAADETLSEADFAALLGLGDGKTKDGESDES